MKPHLQWRGVRRWEVRRRGGVGRAPKFWSTQENFKHIPYQHTTTRLNSTTTHPHHNPGTGLGQREGRVEMNHRTMTTLPWWHHMLLTFFNFVLRWNVVPSSWKLSHVVPVFKHGDPAEPDHYKPISLVSCVFKIFERLVHGRIAPHISDRFESA